MNAIVHDFSKPTRLPLSWQTRLTAWCRTALTLANKAWAKELPVALEASVRSIDVDYAPQALARLPEGYLGYRINSLPRSQVGKPDLPGTELLSYLVLPRSLILNLVGALLGETGAGQDRELTSVEASLAEYFLAQQWLSFFRSSWPGPPPGSWALDPPESNPQCSRCFAGGEVVVTLDWQIKGPWGETAGLWFYRKKDLLGLLGGDESSLPPAMSEAQVAARRAAVVNTLPLTVEVVLGRAELKLSQLSRLQVGDVVILDQENDEGATARAGGRKLFHGQIGRVGSWKAFQIESAVER